jgi:hypothetical protein
MKLWFRLTIVCGALVCLLLGLSQPVGLNHPGHVVGTGPWLDRCRAAASDSPTTSLVRSLAFHPVRAGPRESLVLDCALTADHLAPPGQETHGPPEPIGSLASCWSSCNSNHRHRASLSPKLLASNVELKNWGLGGVENRRSGFSLPVAIG